MTKGNYFLDILLGIFLLMLGLAVAMTGLQLFFYMLPVIGFVSGFYVGSGLVAVVFDDNFLGTLTGWVVGIVVGLLFAVVARYWWYLGVLIASGVVGAILLSGIGSAIGFSSNLSLSMFAIAGAAIAIIITILLNLPVYIVIANTAMSGAAIAVSGVLLVLNLIDREDLDSGAAVAAVKASWYWVIAWVVVVVVGVLIQLAMRERVSLPENRWSSAQQSDSPETTIETHLDTPA